MEIELVWMGRFVVFGKIADRFSAMKRVAGKPETGSAEISADAALRRLAALLGRAAAREFECSNFQNDGQQQRSSDTSLLVCDEIASPGEAGTSES